MKINIPVIKGAYIQNNDFLDAIPKNMTPILQGSGVSEGYLSVCDGMSSITNGPGVDRGGICWNGGHYRVSGTSLINVSGNGSIQTLGTIPGSDVARMDYSYDALSISADGKLFYWAGGTLTQVTDPDLGVCLDHAFIDGYFIPTDGTYVMVTELNDRTSINPIKYGSAESDPDPIVAVRKVSGRLHVVGRYSIEQFENVGGSNFPFQVIRGATATAGAISKDACCVARIKGQEALIFVGSGKNEDLSLYVYSNGAIANIATRTVSKIINEYSNSDLLKYCLLEQRVIEGRREVLIHLPTKTIVYNLSISDESGGSIFSVLSTSLVGDGRYLGRSFVEFAGDSWCGSPTGTEIGVLNRDSADHWGQKVAWEFNVGLIYNKGDQSFINSIEVVAITGGVPLGESPMISTSFTENGVNYSQEDSIPAGNPGESAKRLVWWSNGMIQNWRGQKFRGDSSAKLSVAAVIMDITNG